MGYIASTVNEFFEKLDKMQQELTRFSQNLDNRSEKIPKLLENFEQTVISLAEAPTGEENAVEQAAKKSLEKLKLTVEDWRKKIEAERKGKEFIRKNEKFLER